MLEILFTSLLHLTPSRPHNCIWNKPNLFTNPLLCSHFLICNIFPIIDKCRFIFTSRIGADILMNFLEYYIVFLMWAALILIFILSKNKGFQSGALLKMPPLSPCMKEFGVDIFFNFYSAPHGRIWDIIEGTPLLHSILITTFLQTLTRRSLRAS